MAEVADVLLAVAHHHWWSNYRTVLLERIGDEFAVHDVGPGFGPNVWVEYPLLGHDGTLAPALEAGASPMRLAHAHQEGHVDPVAGLLAGALASVIVGAMREREARIVSERLAQLCRLEVPKRLEEADERCAPASVRRLPGKRPGQWVLSTGSPRRRYFVAAPGGAVDEVARRLAALGGSSAEGG